MSLRYLFTHYRSTIASASLILAVSALGSRLLGLIRDRLLAGRFGTGTLVDAYQISFLLPDFIYNLFIIGALSASFLPIFLEVHQKDKNKAWELSSSLLNLLIVFIIGILFLCFLFTPQIVNLLSRLSEAGGMHYEKENLNLIVKLTRLMLLSPLLLGLSTLTTSILQGLRHFLTPALSPIVYNLGIILGIIVFSPFWGIYGVAWGVIIGALFHFLIQLPSLLATGFKYSLVWKLNAEAIKIIKLSLPRTLGLVAQQASLWINKIIAFTLSVGAVSVYYFANNLQFLPIGLFGTSLAVATFPDLAQSTNGKGGKEFIKTFSRSFRQILYLTVPASIIFLLLRAQIVRIVLGTGEFDWTATILTARTLGFFALSIFAQSLVMLLARAFYALKDTKTPVMISLGSLVINIVLALLFSRSLGVAGLALAYSIASFIDMFLLLIVLRLRVNNLDDLNIIKCVLKIILASAITGAVVYGSLYLIAPLVNMHRFWGVFVQASGAILIGISVYIFLTWLLKCEEIQVIAAKVKTWRNQISKIK